MSETEKNPAELLLEALDRLHASLDSSSKEKRAFAELVGHLGVGLDRIDMVRYVWELRDQIASSVQSIDWTAESNEETGLFLTSFAQRVDQLTSVSVPQLWNGNGGAASSSILTTLLTMQQLMAQWLKWPEARSEYSMPHRLSQRIRAANARLKQVEANTEGLDEKLALILRTHEAAETFPTDLEELERIRKQVDSIAQACTAIQAKLEEHRQNADDRMTRLDKQAQEAEAIVAKCKDAYRNATSTGLAGAFQEKASKLNISIAWWTTGLLVALGLGAFIGSNRIAVLSELVTQDASAGSIILQIALSLLSVGAPLWFAWLATSQIGQRFRLAEDYAFKASVSKAYEGYRSEADMLNSEAFSTRLFSAALDRLEEPPIRLLEKSGLYSSPVHEFLDSPAFHKALDTMPALRSKLADLVSAPSRKADAKVPPNQNATPDA